MQNRYGPQPGRKEKGVCKPPERIASNAQTTDGGPWLTPEVPERVAGPPFRGAAVELLEAYNLLAPIPMAQRLTRMVQTLSTTNVVSDRCADQRRKSTSPIPHRP